MNADLHRHFESCPVRARHSLPPATILAWIRRLALQEAILATGVRQQRIEHPTAQGTCLCLRALANCKTFFTCIFYHQAFASLQVFNMLSNLLKIMHKI